MRFENALAVLATSLALAVSASAPGYAASPKPGSTFSDCKDCPKMVVVPPGTFQMGADRMELMREGERPLGPVHTVTIGYSFAAGAYEVSNKEFGAFIKDSGYKPAGSCQVWGGIEVKDGKTWQDPDYGVPTTPQQPVVCVTWNDAKAYTAWLSKKTGKKYRLLSEAEWEYANRAGSKAEWPWGDDAKRICEFANTYDIEGRKDPRMTNDGGGAAPAELCDDHQGIASPVGSFKPNAFGLYDMVGNVWEWAEDCSLLPYPATVPTDGSPVEVQGPCEKRTNRGGSWRSRLSRQSPAFRGRDPEPTASNIFGFRVARDLK